MATCIQDYGEVSSPSSQPAQSVRSWVRFHPNTLDGTNPPSGRQFPVNARRDKRQRRRALRVVLRCHSPMALQPPPSSLCPSLLVQLSLDHTYPLRNGPGQAGSLWSVAPSPSLGPPCSLALPSAALLFKLIKLHFSHTLSPPLLQT